MYEMVIYAVGGKQFHCLLAGLKKTINGGVYICIIPFKSSMMEVQFVKQWRF